MDEKDAQARDGIAQDLSVNNATMRYALNSITTRRLNQLAQLGTLEKVERGKWPLIANVRAYIAYKESKETIEDQENDPRAATVRLKNEQALAVALENARTMKTQLLAEEVMWALERIQVIYNNSIDALEGRLVGQLVSETGVKSDVLLAVIKPELHAVRDSISRELAALADKLGKPENPESEVERQ